MPPPISFEFFDESGATIDAEGRISEVMVQRTKLTGPRLDAVRRKQELPVTVKAPQQASSHCFCAAGRCLLVESAGAGGHKTKTKKRKVVQCHPCADDADVPSISVELKVCDERSPELELEPEPEPESACHRFLSSSRFVMSTRQSQSQSQSRRRRAIDFCRAQGL